MPSLRLRLSDTRQKWRVVCVLFRWAGKDYHHHHHHLLVNICGSLGLFSWWVGSCWCIPKFCLFMGSQSSSWACFPWLLILEMPWHLQLKFLEFVLSFWLCIFCVYLFFFPSSLCCLIFSSLLFDSYCLSQLPCLFSQGIPPAAHSNVFTRLGIAVTTDVTCLMPRSWQPFVNWFLVQRQFFCFGNPTKTVNWKGPCGH